VTQPSAAPPHLHYEWEFM